MQELGQRLARAGMVTRGVLYALIGWLAVQVALGDRGRRVDQKGAMATLVRQPLGRVLVLALALALGFLAYAAWRFIDGVFDREDSGPMRRLACIGRAFLYVGLAVTAFRIVAHGERVAGGERPVREAAEVLRTVEG